MDFVTIQKENGVATLVISRGKVNALNGIVVDEIRRVLASLETDVETNVVILTGQGKFFSFGFDIPEFLSYTKDDFSRYLTAFTDLYTYMFLYPKPIVAALNGHTIAGGCMLALACDHRVMATGKARISLNEITFGSSVFVGSTKMLRFWIGSKNATKVLYSGALYSAEEAKELSLIEDISSEQDVVAVATKTALELGSKNSQAFASIKHLLRKSVVEDMRRREAESIKEFVEIWYSRATWENLKKIKIYQ